MRLRNIPGARETIAESRYTVKNYKEYKGKWNELFGNDNEIHIEIGMGKGKFIIDNALKYPHINFIGIEKYSSVLVRAIQKVEELDIGNLRFISMDAEDLEDTFEQGEIGKIYLNFSDPWPKKRHAKRRLTYHTFLAEYQQILVPAGKVELKTDNMGFFEFSLQSMNNFGMHFDGVWLDLHHSDENDHNVETEYEHKFASKGQPIYKLTATMPKK